MKKTPKGPYLEVYRDRQREWRWRVRSRNQRILADGGEGYKRTIDLRRAARSVGRVLEMNTYFIDAFQKCFH